ncbi:MAG: hypothetical protein H0U56_09075 [Methylibium sp.]|uniref:hypothetical protein n=1 Tax=Methylibium sp. TaxID=2067992 RepID=UPI00182A7A73|nr:hypothetical protein [Methylibium sp.]MBA2723034.1 hypothetical protein [Methylibium sp.]MBA3589080.1 hypothetical protein [Methylibium sp.]
MTTTRPKAHRLDQVADADNKVADWVSRKLTLKEIVAEVASLGITVSDMTVLRRIQRLGLSLANAPVAQTTGSGPWLSAYRDTIVALWEDGLTYAQIWDELARRQPLVAQFGRPMSRNAKSATMSAWVHAEKKRAARPRRGRLLDALTPAVASRQNRGTHGTRQAATLPTMEPTSLHVLASTHSPAAQESGALRGCHTHETPTIRVAERRAQVSAQVLAERDADAAATSAQQKAVADAVVKRLLAQ